MSKATDELHWRETYFILFPQDRRPQLEQVTQAIARANPRYQLENPSADDNGMLLSVMVESPEDHAAVEISYEVGESVVQQNFQFVEQLQGELPTEKLREIMDADARLDVAHFERMPAGSPDLPVGPSSSKEGLGINEFSDDEFGSEEENFDMLDPTCLLTVVEALSQITQGLALDPASGEILE